MRLGLQIDYIKLYEKSQNLIQGCTLKGNLPGTEKLTEGVSCTLSNMYTKMLELLYEIQKQRCWLQVDPVLICI